MNGKRLFTYAVFETSQMRVRYVPIVPPTVPARDEIVVNKAKVVPSAPSGHSITN
jgi:hypothetical protein